MTGVVAAVIFADVLRRAEVHARAGLGVTQVKNLVGLVDWPHQHKSPGGGQTRRQECQTSR